MKPHILIITAIFTLGMFSCSSDDNVNPEPPATENPLIGKWELKKVKIEASFGEDQEKDFENGDLKFHFLPDNSNTVKINIVTDDENFDQFPNLDFIYPFYQEGIFEYSDNETHDSLTFHLDYWAEINGGPIYKNVYRIENDTLFIGRLYALADDGATREMIFVREK